MDVLDYFLKGHTIFVEKANITLYIKDSGESKEQRLAVLEASIIFNMQELKDGSRKFILYVDIPGSVLIETHEPPYSTIKFLCNELNTWIKENDGRWVYVCDGIVNIKNHGYEPVHIGYDEYIANNVASGYNRPFVRYLT